ncbi:MAG: tRNA preQ1(34) S-adenosylmethionine ribosyltransferase-isomerase QueA [Epulopiscium sp. Nele67-Bin001]|nr:MAG: tRNA preQ1(34) S-adenosylmethionine ribosyltransferase-isomerase QueA [Epulopiscium sp. Nele67-Bin001]
MQTSDFYFELPEQLIAQIPLQERSSSRLMVLDKNSGEIRHDHFYNIIEYLEKGDCLVLNDTRVMPARLFGNRENTAGKVEFLLLTRIEEKVWEVLVKPGKKARIGEKIIFADILSATVIDLIEDGKRLVKFEYEGIFEQVLDKLGEMPLPPYITEKLDDKERYQTVYSKHTGSVAAPTAGLHFTKELLNKVKSKGIDIAYVTLHVGLGTFRPVKVENIFEHDMHAEFYMIDDENARIINKCKDNDGKVICVGTTSCRTIESIADEEGRIVAKSGWTNIFIYPTYKFKCVDNLITNFHLPESTLIMLVSALAGKHNVLEAYDIAVNEQYRFFSFGDAMFIR